MALIPSDVKQVVLLVSGVTGMAPMSQTLHTLLEERRGDGIGEKELRRLELHVVWFEQNLERVDTQEMSSPYAPSTSLEVSTACAELERLSRLHLNKLVVEPVDAGSTFAQGSRVIESVSQQRRSKLTFLQRLDACGPPTQSLSWLIQGAG